MRRYTFTDYATQGYAALVALLILCFHGNMVAHWPLFFGAHVLGLLLIHGLIIWHSKARPNPVLDFFRHFYPVILYTAFFCETGSINRMFFPNYLDPQFIRLEEAIFHCQPSVLFMAKLPYLPLSELFYFSYFSYYLMIAGVGFALFLRNRRQFFQYIAVVSFLFYVCYLTYVILPVIGSRAFFHQVEGYSLPPDSQAYTVTDQYPEAVTKGPFFKLMIVIYRIFEAPGAGFPSSHVAVAWCTVYFSFRYLRPIRWIHLFLAICLCMATVYCRYHYVIDVIAGVLTVALVLPLANWLYSRYGGSPVALPAGQGSERS